MIQIVRSLFADHNDQQFAVRSHCASCVAHRLLKVGWENGVNYYDARNLVLVAMYLPVHCRPRLVDEAYNKAMAADDQRTVAWLAALYQEGALEARLRAGAA